MGTESIGKERKISEMRGGGGGGQLVGFKRE